MAPETRKPAGSSPLPLFSASGDFRRPGLRVTYNGYRLDVCTLKAGDGRAICH